MGGIGVGNFEFERLSGNMLQHFKESIRYLSSRLILQQRSPNLGTKLGILVSGLAFQRTRLVVGHLLMCPTKIMLTSQRDTTTFIHRIDNTLHLAMRVDADLEP
jgi:hypothetical protein